MTARVRPVVTIEPRNLDVESAANVYAVSTGTIHDLIRHHGFPCVRIGRRIVIPVAQADAWFADRATGIPLAVAS